MEFLISLFFRVVQIITVMRRIMIQKTLDNLIPNSVNEVLQFIQELATGIYFPVNCEDNISKSYTSLVC